MSKNICFVANQKKTVFFNGIAQELLKCGVNIYWITISDNLKEDLHEEYGADRVLSLSRRVSGDPIADFRLNEIVFSDRSLKEQQSWAFSYLNGIQQPIYDFLKKNKIEFVFGEVTWAHEMLVLRMTKKLSELNCTYISPHTVRMPSGYFGFFTDEGQSDLIARPLGVDFEIVKLKAVKPDYLQLNDKVQARYYSVGGRFKRIIDFLLNKNYEIGNPAILHSKVKKVAANLRREVNRELYRLVEKKKFDFEGVDYVFYPLHKQPEASVDIIGRYYDDQYTCILNIWRSLPDNWLLLVKEHSNAIGDRGIAFYRKVAKLNNVFFVSENEDSHYLIKHSKAVVTISGTAAYEAALLGKVSFTFAKVFFNNIVSCNKLTFEQISFSSLDKVIECAEEQDGKNMLLPEYEDWLSARIFKGVVSDPDSNSACMVAENLVDVSRAFKVIISMD